MDEEKKGMDRRQFIRRAAVTTAAAAWAAPVIQTVTASPAFAGTPEECDHSGCIGACGDTAGGNANCGGPPGQVCQDLLALHSGAADEAPQDGSNNEMDGLPGDPCAPRELPALHATATGSTMRASQ